MSSELQQYNAPSADLPGTVTTRATGSDLIREAAAVMADAHALAKAISGTSMVPQHFRNKPEECAAAMLYGASLGLDPMQSVKTIYVVNGNAAMYASGMAAIVRRDGHELRDVAVSDTSVTVAGRRAGTTDWVERTWTIERAQTAGYTKNARYDTNPQQMLHAKAISEVCRVIAPDSLAGVYSVEERQMEYIDAEVVDVKRPTKGLGAALANDSSPAPGEAPAATAAQASGAGEAPKLKPTSKLAKDLGAAVQAAKIDPPDVPDFFLSVLDRRVEGYADLTEDEARKALAALQAAIAEDGE